MPTRRPPSRSTLPRWSHPRYELIERLGEGGSGQVFRARDRLEDGLEVALKVCPAPGSPEPLRREFLLLRSLRHPGIARAFDFGTSGPGGHPYFTMESIRGPDLATHLEEILPAGEVERADRILSVTDLFLQACASLGHLHDRGLLHLDLKPGNILVLSTGAPLAVLIDLGLARRAGDGRGKLRGTLPYMAPEQFQGRAPDVRTDLYQLGATFYRAYTGHRALDGETERALIEAHLKATPRPAPELPEALERILSRLLTKQPAHRFSSTQELAESLLSFRRGLEPDRAPFLPDPGEIPLQGRDEELGAVDRWLASSGPDSLCLRVHGLPGSGRTRLIDEIETRLLASTGPLPAILRLEGDGRETGSWVESLVRRTAVFSPPRSRDRKRFHLLFPAENSPAAEPDSEPYRHQAVAWLGEGIGRRGLFVLLDHLESATGELSPATADFLERLTRRLSLEGEPSPDDRRRRGGLILSTTEVAGGDLELPATRLETPPLDHAAIEGWLAARSPGQRPSTAEIDALRERTGGLPLRLRADLEAMRAGLPSGASATSRRLRHHLLALEGGAREVLLVLALTRQSPTAARLAAVLRWPRDRLEGELRLLEARGWVSRAGGTDRRALRPEHAAWIRQSASEAELRETRQLLVERPEVPGESGLERAWHLFDLGREEEAREALATALERPEPKAWHRFPESLELLERLLEKSDALDTRLLKAARRMHAEIALERGRLEAATGSLQALLDDGPGEAEEDWRVRERLAQVEVLLGRPERVEALLGGVLEQATRSASPRAGEIAAHAALAAWAHYHRSPREAIRIATRGLERWDALVAPERSRSEPAAVHLHAIVGQAHIRRFEFARAIEILERGARLTARSFLEAGLLLNNLGLARHIGGSLTGALATFGRARSIAREIADENLRLPVTCNLAQIHAKLGDRPAAAAALEEAGSIAMIERSPRLSLHVEYTRALVESVLGAPLPETWSEVTRRASETGDAFLLAFARLQLAEAWLLAGRSQEARESLEALVSESGEPETGPETEGASLSRRLGTHAACRLALLDALTREAPRDPGDLEGLAGELAAASPDPGNPWSRLFLARAASRRGEPRRARDWLESARREFRAAGHVAGLVEADLVACGLSLRDGRHREGLRRLESLEARRDARSRELDLRHAPLRIPLLRARLELLQWERSPASPPPAPLLRDLLARAEGDPHFEDLALEQLAARAVRQALEGLGCAPESGSPAPVSLETVERPATRLAGLERFSPPSIALPEAGAKRYRRGIDGLLERAVRSGDSDALWLESYLEEMARQLGGEDAIAAIYLQRDEDPIGVSHPAQALRPGAMKGLLRRLPPVLAISGLDTVTGLERTLGARGKRLVRSGGSLLSDPWRGSEGEIQGAVLLVTPRPPGEHTPDDLNLFRLALHGLRLGLRPEAGERERPGRRRKEVGEDLTRTLTRELTRSLTGAPTIRPEAMSRPPLEDDLEIVTRDERFLALLRDLDAAAAADLPLLVWGEAGTGKDLLARRAHAMGPRRAAPFLVQNLGSIPPALLEAELFGARRGAYSGAERTRTGLLLQAQGGTFLLDAVEELSAEAQAKVLRLLESREVRPVGGDRATPLDVRFIATSQQDLLRLVEEGTFRRDLYHRLAGVALRIPPLRERPDDVLPLLRHLCRVHLGEVPRISRSAREILRSHPWPGNAREVEGLVRRLALRRAPGESLDLATLKGVLETPAPRRPFSPDLFRRHDVEDLRRELDRTHLEFLFAEHRGDLEAVARALGTSVRGVYRRLEKHDRTPGEFLRELGLRPPPRGNNSGDPLRRIREDRR